jgi:hypothetical protein
MNPSDSDQNPIDSARFYQLLKNKTAIKCNKRLLEYWVNKIALHCSAL